MKKLILVIYFLIFSNPAFSLVEVDNAIYQHGEIINVSSVRTTLKTAHGEEEVIIALVVKEDKSSIGEIDLKKHCLKMLSHYKVPHQIFFVDSLPQGGSGKILRSKVKLLFDNQYKNQVKNL